MIDESSGKGFQGLVQELLTRIGMEEVPVEEAEHALSRCQSFLANKKMLDEIAKELSLSLSSFQTTDVLEIYYDIGWKGKDFGSISKGWKDPGFRITEVINLGGDEIERFRQKADKILNTCATQGVGCGVQIIEEDQLQLDFSICLYQEGFNAPTLKNALETFDLCMSRVMSLLST